MRTIKLSISVLLVVFFVQNSWAKNQKIGVYLTLNDYLDHKLSYESGGTNGTRIKLNNLFETTNVVVQKDGKKEFFSKSKIFGYRINNQDYRYFNNSAYEILDTQGFYIYGHSKLVQEGKGPKPTEQYYFSAKPNAEIKQLTMDNLQTVFTGDTRFLYSVEGFFKSDQELMAYDPGLKTYKIKYLYSQTVK